MEEVFIWILFALGLVLIIKGGDFFVDAAGFMAEASGIPKFIIGATIVSIATTLPEIIVSTIAAIDGSNAATPELSEGYVALSIGNAVGSVTANIAFILALLLVFAPPVIKRKQLAFKSVIMLFSVLALWLLSLTGKLTVLASSMMLIIFAVYIVENVITAKKEQNADVTRFKPEKKQTAVNIIKFIAGAAGIVIGARLLVDSGTAIARTLGVPERIISLTMVAIGTSLPELVTAITALVKKQGSMSVGNIIGANIIDITVILPVCSLVYGGSLPISTTTLQIDMPICLCVSVLTLVPALICGKFKRWQGIALLCIYVGYIAFLITGTQVV